MMSGRPLFRDLQPPLAGFRIHAVDFHPSNIIGRRKSVVDGFRAQAEDLLRVVVSVEPMHPAIRTRR
jgi:hypothetical protein